MKSLKESNYSPRPVVLQFTMTTQHLLSCQLESLSGLPPSKEVAFIIAAFRFSSLVLISATIP